MSDGRAAPVLTGATGHARQIGVRVRISSALTRFSPSPF
ncbi:hypothetical protein XCR_1249 [Xanthomonas campestris pv. raphani 756C]|nr:hypothetical protein XCR_1249 [Xanthomonas campestris pv. raphani 756C]